MRKKSRTSKFNTLKNHLIYGVHRANIFIFSWYYENCGEHFKQWNFRKSVKLLIQNYEHTQLILNNEITHNRNLTRDNDEMRKELCDIKIKMISTDGQINWANKNLGIGIRKNSDN